LVQVEILEEILLLALPPLVGEEEQDTETVELVNQVYQVVEQGLLMVVVLLVLLELVILVELVIVYHLQMDGEIMVEMDSTNLTALEAAEVEVVQEMEIMVDLDLEDQVVVV
jgi:hypothetical protein